MALRLFVFVLANFFCIAASAQNSTQATFTHRCAPTSTDDYSIEITREKMILKQTEKILNRRRRVKDVKYSTYTYIFTSEEQKVIDSMIRNYNLDSPGTYGERQTEWGALWEVKIVRQSITYNIKLPNYNNAGLEKLIKYVSCLIPKKELPRFQCVQCN